jgi:hypothetical protein
VDPDTSDLVAVLVAVCALLVVGFAAGVTLLAIRFRSGAIRARDRVTVMTSDVRRNAPGVRARIELSASRVDRLREQWAATDQAVTDLTGSLTSLRGSLERLTRGRLAMLIRGAGIVSKAAQVALLWR